MVLSPRELPLVNKYYSPTQEEVEWAEEMISLATAAQQEGRGVALKDNKFIGPPMVKMANKILNKQRLIEARHKN